MPLVVNLLRQPPIISTGIHIQVDTVPTSDYKCAMTHVIAINQPVEY